MKRVALPAVQEDLPKYLHLAEKDKIIITRKGKPVGVLMGFATEDDWLDFVIENHPRFLKRVARARKSLREGKGVLVEDLPR